MKSPSRARSRPPESGPKKPRRGLLYFLPILLGAGVVAFLVFAGDPPPSPRRVTPPPSAAGPPSETRAAAIPGALPSKSPEAPADSADPNVAALRVERARRTLDDYVAATKYPPISRPISEHPDLVQPLHAVDHAQRLVRGGATRLRIRYDRTFLVGDDAVRVTLRGEDEAGNPLPCRVLDANATEAPFSPGAGRRGPAVLSFVNDGAGTFATTFVPARQGFAEHLGPIRIEVRARVEDEEGTTSFDVYYTPAPPARFTGAAREVLAAGSLELYLGIDVKKAGRYLVDARAADASGRPFAFLSFNEELPAGKGEVKLVLFGKLVRDLKAAAPFVLRDVEGHLLKEDTDPDREIMAPLLGTVHTTRGYPESAFSAAEWQSEERARHIDEFTRNLRELEEAAAAGNGGKAGGK